MKISSSTHANVFVIALKGKIMGGPEAGDFHEELKKAIGNGHKKVILDLGEVEWMNSSGLGVLISGFTTLKNAGGEMKLARATDKIESLLVITKLNSVFDAYPTIDAAAGSFN